VRQDEIDTLSHQQTSLQQVLEKSRLRLDAIRLIILST